MSVDQADLAGRGAFWAATADGASEILQPLGNSASGWASDQLRGMAVSGALARATERTATQQMPEMVPTRWGVDLFRPARVRPTIVSTTVIRQGSRIGLIDAELHQEGRLVARSRVLMARPSPAPAGRVWRPDHARPLTPPAGLRPAGDEPRLYYSEQEGWTASAELHQNSSRKSIWHSPVVVVEGEDVTAFQLVASVADMANLAVNWGSAGVEFINADIDLVLTRLPATMEVGLAGVDRAERDGVAVGTAAVFDRVGHLGNATVVAVANPVRRVDPGNRRPDLSAFTR